MNWQSIVDVRFAIKWVNLKRMGKVKKYELTLDDEQPFEVYGISTAFADYRLTWELNQMLDIHLEKEQERFEVYLPKIKSQQEFSYFFYEDQELLTRFFLIKNKQDQQLLQADRPMIDYFLVLKDNFSHEPDALIEKLRSINGIVAVFSFNHEEFDILDYFTS